ncbi:MAG: hypothetical protein WBL84_09940, partial [Xanthobacteraceae bacterium]
MLELHGINLISNLQQEPLLAYLETRSAGDRPFRTEMMPWLCQIISSTIATLFQYLLPDEQNSDRGLACCGVCLI